MLFRSLRAGGRLRQLRHLPVAAGDLGRHGARAEAAVHHRAAGPGTRPAVRRRAGHRHPAGQEDHQGGGQRAPRAEDLRHRHRAERVAVARRGAAADGPGAARGAGRVPDPRDHGSGRRGAARAAVRDPAPRPAAAARRARLPGVRRRRFGGRGQAGRRRPDAGAGGRVRAAARLARRYRQGAGRPRLRRLPRRDAARDRGRRPVLAGRARRDQRRRRVEARQVRRVDPGAARVVSRHGMPPAARGLGLA